MRIGGRRLGVAGAGLLLVVVLAIAGVALMRWKAAGVAHAVTPPAGAVAPAAGSPGLPRDVLDRAAVVALSLRNDRGDATVRAYALPPGSGGDDGGRSRSVYVVIGSGLG